jgi:prepilin-type N-terminal cleavage/methylation domain-containing protein
MSDTRHILPKANAFTLIELLTVIAIIGILAAMTLAVINMVMVRGKKMQATTDIAGIQTAIAGYEQTYGVPPVSAAMQQSGFTNITCGGPYVNGSNTQWPPSPLPANYEPGNSNIISILLDITNFPGGGPTANANHQKNSRQQIFLDAKMRSDASSPGVGTDLNFRDPWGNPYIITIDLNEDNKCEDLFYASYQVSSANGQPNGPGLNGLILQPDNHYAFHGNVMVWSMGPDGPFNHAPSSFDTNQPATAGPNKNHILSWQ